MALELAKRILNSTRSHLFLTGKAGTGKTTFLKSLSSITHKSFIVVAPTGIAALNAGGVTIHSQFLFPFGTFIPDRFGPEDASGETRFYTQNTLAQKHPLSSVRKQVLRSIDLLVIDEVSMLRADLLDAIDYRMKAVRGNFAESFGGVQVLFIGDLYQLPPVVKRDEQSLLSRYYKTPWFYEAKALSNDGLILIELDKIYRQHDSYFIDLLNRLRNNQLDDLDVETLNKYYKSPDDIAQLEEVITLTTHNAKAEELNIKALHALPERSYFFSALTEGEFPESMFPVLERIELKVGTQIMFVRNDTDGAYFNGKLATVREISGQDIWVEMAGSHERYKLKREKWDNKKYVLNTDTRDLDEEVIGSFEQYPVKLAWAITVHKSQGLTFEKAIIDVGEAFADGQVYVALSRLRSLEGLVMRTKINRKAVTTDLNVVGFVKHHHQPESLEERIKERQHDFLKHLLERTFNFESIEKEFQYVIRTNKETLFKVVVRNMLQPLADALSKEQANTAKFTRQLSGLLQTDKLLLLERLEKGCEYYHNLLTEKLTALIAHEEEVKHQKRSKTYLNQLTELDALLTRKINEVDKVRLIASCILNGIEDMSLKDVSARHHAERAAILQEIRKSLPTVKPKKRKKKNKSDERSTYDITLEMFNNGMPPEKIASERNLVISTVESHLARAVESRLISISKLVDDPVIAEIKNARDGLKEPTLTAIHVQLKRKYSYGIIRAVLSHLESEDQTVDTSSRKFFRAFSEI
jgi:energy-coupling factor transporter ATP-binding protein EcfA2